MLFTDSLPIFDLSFNLVLVRISYSEAHSFYIFKVPTFSILVCIFAILLRMPFPTPRLKKIFPPSFIPLRSSFYFLPLDLSWYKKLGKGSAFYQPFISTPFIK